MTIPRRRRRPSSRSRSATPAMQRGRHSPSAVTVAAATYLAATAAFLLSASAPSSSSHRGGAGAGGDYHFVASSVVALAPPALAFVPRGRRSGSSSSSTSLRMSSIGGGNMDNNDGRSGGGGGGGGGGGENDENNPLNEWMSRRDTENVRIAREQFAEGRLPISYGAMNENDDERQQDGGGEEKKKKKNGNNKFGPLKNSTEEEEEGAIIDATSSSSSSLSRSASRGGGGRAANPYLSVVSRLAPSDLISRFTSTASPRVQDAVRTTVLGLIGGLPQMALETRTVATGERLASLMFQLQMTGYMFKNAEYRLSLSQSLGRSSSGDRMLPGDATGDNGFRDGRRIKGKIKVRYGGGGAATGNDDDVSGDDNSDDDDENKDQQTASSFSTTPGMEVEVDAKAYMSELRGEVERLKEELEATRQAKDEAIRKDLLMYIRTLPPPELQRLTGTMSPEVLEAMKGLVTAVLAGIGDDDDDSEGTLGDNVSAEGGGANRIGPETVTEQSGEALAQLCMWQLVVGFNLRELEVREEFRASMGNVLGEGIGDGDDDGDGGGDGGGGGVQFGPGALE